jgi:hypothetical protein
MDVVVTMVGFSTLTVLVNVSTTTNGTAETDVDFESFSETVVWEPGESGLKTVQIKLLNDAIDEDDETINVTLTNPKDAILTKAADTAAILDDDVSPTLSISVDDAQEDGGGMDIEISIQGSSVETVSATVSTTLNGSAASGTDFEALSTTVEWAPETIGTKTVQITLHDDLTDEHDETIHVELTDLQNAVIATGSDTAAIQDDDPQPFITVNDATGNEGETISFAVELSEASGKDIDFTYELTNESANVIGRDVVAGDDTAVTIPAGDVTTTILAQLANDPRDEGDEVFNIILTVDPETVAADQRSTTTATGTIIDNDVAFVLEPGWTMIGIPDGTDAPADMHSTTLLYPRPTIWAWDAVAKRYDVFDETSDVTTAGSAYFAYASEAATLLFEIPAAPSSIELTAGWNLIAVTVQMDFAALSPAVIGVAWTWDGQTLVPVSQLEPRRAYWVYATEAAAIEF